jgi:hypothetical protein
MKSPSFDISTLEVDNTTRHQELVGRFTERLNPDRIAAGYPPYSYKRVAMLLQNLTYNQREELFIDCEKASCGFSRYFGWRIKNKTNK